MIFGLFIDARILTSFKAFSFSFVDKLPIFTYIKIIKFEIEIEVIFNYLLF